MTDLTTEAAPAMRDGVTIEIRQRRAGYLVILWVTPGRVAREGTEREICLEPDEIRELLLAILMIDPLFLVAAPRIGESGSWTAADGLSSIWRREYSTHAALVPVMGSRVREHSSGAVSWAPTVEEILKLAAQIGERWSTFRLSAIDDAEALREPCASTDEATS